MSSERERVARLAAESLDVINAQIHGSGFVEPGDSLMARAALRAAEREGATEEEIESYRKR